jgi:hypothetical protein
VEIERRQLERMSRLEIQRRTSIQRESQEHPPRPDPDRYPTCTVPLTVATTSVCIQRPPPWDLKLYIEHSRDAQAKQMQEGYPKLSQCWGVIAAGLSNPRVSPAFVPGYLDSVTLRKIWRYEDDTLLVLLIALAKQAGLGKVAEVYMQPFL